MVPQVGSFTYSRHVRDRANHHTSGLIAILFLVLWCWIWTFEVAFWLGSSKIYRGEITYGREGADPHTPRGQDLLWRSLAAELKIAPKRGKSDTLKLQGRLSPRNQEETNRSLHCGSQRFTLRLAISEQLS